MKVKPAHKISSPLYFDISDDITMYTLLNNMVFDIFHYVVCVDFLGTHMASLILFFKTRCDNRCEDNAYIFTKHIL
jgi:hypothetical protein